MLGNLNDVIEAHVPEGLRIVAYFAVMFGSIVIVFLVAGAWRVPLKTWVENPKAAVLEIVMFLFPFRKAVFPSKHGIEESAGRLHTAQGPLSLRVQSKKGGESMDLVWPVTGAWGARVMTTGFTGHFETGPNGVILKGMFLRHAPATLLPLLILTAGIYGEAIAHTTATPAMKIASYGAVLIALIVVAMVEKHTFDRQVTQVSNFIISRLS